MPTKRISHMHRFRSRPAAFEETRSGFDAWQRQPTGAGVLLLTGTSGAPGDTATRARSLVIPLFSDTDLDGLIEVLSEPTEESDRP
jgi:hypothetical protein